MSQIPKYINPFDTQELNMGGQVEYKCTVPPQKLAVTLYWPNTYNIWQSLWENRQQTYNIWPTLWENWQNTYDIWETVKKLNLSIHSNCEKTEPKHTLKQSSEDEMKKKSAPRRKLLYVYPPKSKKSPEPNPCLSSNSSLPVCYQPRQHTDRWTTYVQHKMDSTVLALGPPDSLLGSWPHWGRSHGDSLGDPPVISGYNQVSDFGAGLMETA